MPILTDAWFIHAASSGRGNGLVQWFCSECEIEELLSREALTGYAGARGAGAVGSEHGRDVHGAFVDKADEPTHRNSE